jgi:hypothetical protein
MQSARRVLQFATGIAVGATGFVVLRVLGVITDRPASGALLGVGGMPVRAIDPIPSWPVGLIVAGLGAGAYFLRSLWWTPIAARWGLILAIGLLFAAGIARFRSVVGILLIPLRRPGGTQSW